VLSFKNDEDVILSTTSELESINEKISLKIFSAIPACSPLLRESFRVDLFQLTLSSNVLSAAALSQ
jgi:hypothetical protein